MEFSRQIQFVADYYGIPSTFFEGGKFSPAEAEKLQTLLDKAKETGEEKDQRAYLEQKAQFILDPTKGILIHDGDTFTYTPRS